MHQQGVVYVDPESELLLVRHPPQINSLQPIKNQPETPNMQLNRCCRTELKNWTYFIHFFEVPKLLEELTCKFGADLQLLWAFAGHGKSTGPQPWSCTVHWTPWGPRHGRGWSAGSRASLPCCNWGSTCPRGTVETPHSLRRARRKATTTPGGEPEQDRRACRTPLPCTWPSPRKGCWEFQGCGQPR